MGSFPLSGLLGDLRKVGKRNQVTDSPFHKGSGSELGLVAGVTKSPTALFIRALEVRLESEDGMWSQSVQPG